MNLLKKLRLRREVAKLAGTRLLAAFAKLRPDAFFVQIGANDGKMMDPINKTINKSQWEGLVIEPVPMLFRQLQKNYAHCADRVQPLNVAIAQSGEKLPFYHLSQVPGLPALPDWAAGLGTFNRDVLLKHRDRIVDLEKYLLQVDVATMSWSALCEQYVTGPIDLLLTDTEGYDYEILRQIDFSKHRPTLIIYEHHHFSEQTRYDCQQMLAKAGYSMFEEGLDTWALQFEHVDQRHAPLREGWAKWIAGSGYAQLTH